jgi:hypothetical protein
MEPPGTRDHGVADEVRRVQRRGDMNTLGAFLISCGLLLTACGGFNQNVDDVAFPFDLAGPDHSASVCPEAYDANMAGQPCAPDGISCAHCSDPCQFCNGFTCQGGKWKAFEAFPMICG